MIRYGKVLDMFRNHFKDACRVNSWQPLTQLNARNNLYAHTPGAISLNAKVPNACTAKNRLLTLKLNTSLLTDESYSNFKKAPNDTFVQ
jgi:hypothetical protein